MDHSEKHGTHRSVVISMTVNFLQAVGLGIITWISGSRGLLAQTADNVAELAVTIFLYIGVLSSSRPADDDHPLGYGRERFFWSLFAALGIFVGGGGLAINGAFASVLHPTPVDSYPIAYSVLGICLLLDMFALASSVPPLRRQAVERGISVRAYLLANSDPTLTTVAAGAACALIGGVIAALGLVASQLSENSFPDALASGLIGVLLLVTSGFLLRTNRELLTGRGVHSKTLSDMRGVIERQEGVIGVPDLFAVFVGPSSIIVNGDVTFADGMSVPEVEESIQRMAALLRERWPSIEFVYLTPVPRARPRRVSQRPQAQHRRR